MNLPPASDDAHPWGNETTPYAALGGSESLERLVDAFYDTVDAEAPTLRAMLPRDDSGSRRKLFEYLSGWLGGPNLYVERRGHPRLRMRHLPFPIGPEEADEWMRCMRSAMEQVDVPDRLRAFLDDRLTPLAAHMVNR